jgi:hypothetical protein
MAEATQAALLRLYRGLGQRELMSDDPRGRAIVDRRLLPALDTLARESHGGEAPALSTPPPRRIAVALALAVYSQPHLASTFFVADGSEAPPLAVEPLVVSNEVLESALGLSSWELDDLREEVDRRAGGVLKQTTLVQWLLSRYEEPSRVLHLLFPGVELRGESALIRRGSHLYAVVDQPSVPRHALYLPWTRPENGASVMPLEAFRGRYVDAGLKRALARGIGATEGEVVDLLERTIALLPREDLERLLEHDGWRNRGLASVTGLGQPYPKLAWLSREVDAGDVRWQDWIQVDDQGARLRDPLAALEALARHRIHHALEALHTDLLARRFVRRDGPREVDDLDVFDVGGTCGVCSSRCSGGRARRAPPPGWHALPRCGPKPRQSFSLGRVISGPPASRSGCDRLPKTSSTRRSRSGSARWRPSTARWRICCTGRPITAGTTATWSCCSQATTWRRCPRTAR